MTCRPANALARLLLAAALAWLLAVPEATQAGALRGGRPRHGHKRAAAAAATPLPQEVGVPAVGATALQQAIGRQVALALRDTAALGVHIAEVKSGETVFSYNGDEARVTASNTKLATTAAALDALGPAYFFETQLLLRGKVEGGALEGDLGVIGGGDPNISGRAFDGDSYAVFRDWARQLSARGVRRVQGDLYLDYGLFEARQIHPDWPRAHLDTWYEAPVAALAFNDNCILVRVSPGRRGGPVRVETLPPVRLLQITSSARTSGSRRHNHLHVLRRDDRLLVAGTIYEKDDPFETWVSVPDSVLYFGSALVDALAEEGVTVAGRLRPVAALPGPVWQRVAVYRSDLLDTVRIANKHSQNFYAESLLKLVGARSCGAGSWQQGVQAVGEFLVGLGVPRGSFQMVDGSGMSRENHFTPRQLTLLLRHMYFHRWGAEFVQSLPASGGSDGSLRHRLASPPYLGNVFAKTGTIEGVSALSGYARAVSGKVYTFSILLNKTRSVWEARQAQDHIVMAVIDNG
ncbi:MAG TPA: D-alanyl-D-alanine carboxypeptidase/D-alanyl-D-alanine-endopeptidase [Thermoanaerobaculia bacterium]|nr:D-alanyl-D-alanine carboxypeptidase/D-alanyl-D-alanine-endopeptidase [Thermoanaerobaculia bacterium]